MGHPTPKSIKSEVQVVVLNDFPTCSLFFVLFWDSTSSQNLFVCLLQAQNLDADPPFCDTRMWHWISTTVPWNHHEGFHPNSPLKKDLKNHDISIISDSSYLFMVTLKAEQCWPRAVHGSEVFDWQKFERRKVMIQQENCNLCVGQFQQWPSTIRFLRFLASTC